MDPTYNVKHAQARLESTVQVHRARKEETQTVDMIEVSITQFYQDVDVLTLSQVDEHRVINTEEPLSWRLINENDISDFEEEVFHLHGVLCAFDLPPIQTRSETIN